MLDRSWSQTIVRPGRISPEQMYPAGTAGISVRWLMLPGGPGVRVIEAGPETGRPVVFVHGWGACVYAFRDALATLAAAGCRTIAVDLPGHGLSEKPMAGAMYTRQALTHTMARVLEVLDLKKVCVVGHSLGGAIALALAVAGDSRVERIALINPVGVSPVRFVRLAKLAVPRAVPNIAPWCVPRSLVRWLLHLAYREASRVTARDIEEYWAPSQLAGFAQAMVLCLHECSWAPITPVQLASIACPVLLVLGDYDHLIRDAERRARPIPALQIVHAPGAHAVHEEYPQEVNAALLAFVHT